MSSVTSLADWKAEKELQKALGDAQALAENGPPCPQCNGKLLPGVDSNQQVWICMECTIIVWTQ